MDNEPIVVAIFNTSPDTIAMLQRPLEKAGFAVVSAYTYELRDGEVDLETFVRQHAPKVVVYDIAPPYEPNWRLFEQLSSRPELQSAFFVVTATNVAQVRKVAGSGQDIHEIVGKPLDLEEIVRAVVEAAHRRPIRSNQPVTNTARHR